MSKLFVAVVLLAIAAFAEPPSPPSAPSADEMKAEMIADGISEKAAAGIINIGNGYKNELETEKGTDAVKLTFEKMRNETEEFMSTQSASDQKAYATFIEKKKKEMEGHHSTPAH